MAEYRCHCTDASGRVRELHREAASEETLLRDLASKGLFPLSIEIDAQTNNLHPGAFVDENTNGLPGNGSARATIRPAGMSAVRDFTDSLSLMTDAGLPVRDALEVASSVISDADNHSSRRLVDFISEKIGSGHSFSQSLEMLGSTFPSLYRALVQIGEQVGSLENVLKRLSEYLRRQKGMRDRIASALAYPLIVFCVALSGVVLIAAVVVPRASELFSQAGTEVPVNLRRLLASANLLVALIVATVTIGAVVVVAAGRARRSGGSAAVRIDSLLLRIPLVGGFLSMRAMVQFCFAMEILTDSGVAVERSLRESAAAVENAALRAALLAAREDMIRGDPLSSALLAHSPFPTRVGRWIRIGERSGSIDRVFSQLRQYYEAEVERWSARTSSLAEPLLTLLVGAFMIVVVLVFITPLFSLYGALLR